jgi:hypothetical protein
MVKSNHQGLTTQSTSERCFIIWAWCIIGWGLFLSGSVKSCFIVGDLNGDCRVGMEDLVLMASQWLAPSSCRSEDGLILHWNLNESSGSAVGDSSGAGHSGSVVGAAWNPAGGIYAGALEFDGVNDYVWSTYKGIPGSNPRTCAAWIKTDRAPVDILSWGDRDIDAARWVVSLDETGVLRVDAGAGHIFGTTVLTDDLWHHVAVVSDGTVTDHITLYIDGRIETIGGVASQSINTLGRATMKLGVFQLLNLQGNYFSGLIDDVRIYDRVLSVQEVWSVATIATINDNCADLNADRAVDLGDAARLSQDWDTASPMILINEFLADNESRSPLGPGDLLDGSFEPSDWIELYNPSKMTVDLGGWYLTDDAGLKTKWRFPASTVLQPGSFLIVFASGKTLAENPANYPFVDPAGYLHTNFSLSKEGEYLGLIDADGTTIIHQYNHFKLGDKYGYPPQNADVSYGSYYDQTRYFQVPTPGADNVGSPFEEYTEKPDVNIKGGCYVDAVDLTMTCGTPGSFIRYTTDGTVPSLTNGLDYTGPIHIDSLTTILAKAFKPGLHPSETRIDTYVFVDPTVTPYDTNLPIIVVDTLGQDIPIDKVNRPYVDCRVVIVDTDDVTGRAEITGPGHFEGWGMIRRRGESTYNSNHYALEIQDEYRQDKAVSLLGMPAESDWILSWDVIDYTMMKNEMAFRWFREMGHYAPRQRYVEVYLNTDGGTISSSDYVGLFMLREKIKRDDNRVDIARLDASHNLEPKVSGGYIIKCDKVNDGDTLLADGSGGLADPDYLEWSPYGIQVTGNGKPIIAEPDALEITQPQTKWIADYMNEFQSVLWQNTASSHYPGPQAKYTDYIDVTTWIDRGFVEQICADTDSFWGSYYTYKDRDGKIHCGPPWDFDRSFHNSGGTYDRPYDEWKANAAIFGKWHQKLEENPEYKMALADRWFEHRKAALNTALTMAYIDQTAVLISEARSRPKKTYPKPLDEEIGLFKTWITNRLNWLDGEIETRFAKRPPIFSPVGGYADPGSVLEISNYAGAAGEIYYTTNGQDPRLEGGAINPNAQLFKGTSTSEIETIVTMASSVWTYLYDGSDQGTAWRAYGFNDSSWGFGPGQLGFGDGDESTYIGPKVNGRRTAYFRHTFNVSSVTELTAMKVTLVHDDGAVVYINDQEVGRVYMPTGTILYDTKANLQGENTNTVFSSIPPSVLMEGDNILAVEVHQNSDTSSDISFDLSLEVTRVIPAQPIVLEKSVCVRARIKDGSSWSAMNTEIYAVGPVLENLRISELMYHPADPNTEFIELQNIGSEPINLNLVTFADGVAFTFGDAVLGAGQYALVVENAVDFALRYGPGPNVLGQYTGQLDNGGERIRLEDALGNPIQEFAYKDGWYPVTDGQGFSLTVVDAADANDLNLKSSWKPGSTAGGSPGQADTASTPLPGSVVINELLAHSHAEASDWIELHNTTDQPINIGGWFISDDDSSEAALMKYQIPLNTIIPAYGYIVFYEAADFNGFAFSENGETAYLTSSVDGQLGGYRISESFGPSPTGIAFGRHYKVSTDSYNFVLMSSITPGSANADPLVGPVVISEIMYHPPTLKDAEYVELLNISKETIQLYDADKGTGWKFTDDGGFEFYFSAGSAIVPGERILIVKNQAVFAGEYAAPAGTQVFEWGDGSLSNSGEKIELSVPGDIDSRGTRYHIRVDRVVYSDGSQDTDPWPIAADGSGQALHRIDIEAYGNDVANWEAATPTPGM